MKCYGPTNETISIHRLRGLNDRCYLAGIQKKSTVPFIHSVFIEHVPASIYHNYVYDEQNDFIAVPLDGIFG